MVIKLEGMLLNNLGTGNVTVPTHAKSELDLKPLLNTSSSA